MSYNFTMAPVGLSTERSVVLDAITPTARNDVRKTGILQFDKPLIRESWESWQT
jgi:hypothetical protein